VTPEETVAMIEQLGPACRKHGVRKVRVGDVEVEFAGPGGVDGDVIKKFQQFLEQGLPTDEEALSWSAPGWAPPAAGDGPPASRNRKRS
jgi:hypothetical protein